MAVFSVCRKLYFPVRRARETMRQLEIVQLAITRHGGKAHYSSIYAEYERITGRPLTDGTKAGIRKCIEDHSSDSDNYKGIDDIFYSVAGKGSGIWGLR